jgi:hypothetical protein
MSNESPSRATPRPRQLLERYNKRYPQMWALLDRMRAERGTHPLVKDWPQHILVPLVGVQALIAQFAGVQSQQAMVLQNPQLLIDMNVMGALAGWRPTQGIYRFDASLFAELSQAPLVGNVPFELLRLLPEWSVYIETPGLRIKDQPIHGAFAHLEWSLQHKREELRLLLDTDFLMISVPLHNTGDLLAALATADEQRRSSAQAFGVSLPPNFLERLITPETVRIILNLLLYICAPSSELDPDGRRPTLPVAKRTKEGLRLFPADKPTIWQVGTRRGEKLRGARDH